VIEARVHIPAKDNVAAALYEAAPRLEKIFGRYGIGGREAEEIVVEALKVGVFKREQRARLPGVLAGVVLVECRRRWLVRRRSKVAVLDSTLADLVAYDPGKGVLKAAIERLGERCQATLLHRYGLGPQDPEQLNVERCLWRFVQRMLQELSDR